jgi:general secretion pathway protein G
MSSVFTPRRSRGFTLVELLTVIAIVAILAGIIIPVVGNVRKKAAMTTSLSNLRQLGNATLVFAAENRQDLPVYDGTHQTHYWLRALWKIVYPELAVPPMPPTPDTSEQFRKEYGGTIFYTSLMEDENVSRSYGYNTALTRYNSAGARTSPATPLKMNELLKPAHAVVMADATSISLTTATAKARNDGLVFCAFADGHVDKLLPPDGAIQNPAASSKRMPSNPNSTFWRGVERSPTGTVLTVW